MCLGRCKLLRSRFAVVSAPHCPVHFYIFVHFHSLSSSPSKTRGSCHAIFFHLVGVRLTEKVEMRGFPESAFPFSVTCFEPA